MSKASDTNKSQELARDRTDWAEDRTLLVNERIFAGRMRAGLISVGMALTAVAAMKAVEPVWLSKTVATAFIMLGFLIFYGAWRSSCRATERLVTHSIVSVSRSRFSLIAVLMSVASAGVAVVLWLT